MDIRKAEAAAADYENSTRSWPEAVYQQAFDWAHRKRSDRRVSPALRERAASVARRLWATSCERGAAS